MIHIRDELCHNSFTKAGEAIVKGMKPASTKRWSLALARKESESIGEHAVRFAEIIFKNCFEIEWFIGIGYLTSLHFLSENPLYLIIQTKSSFVDPLTLKQYPSLESLPLNIIDTQSVHIWQAEKGFAPPKFKITILWATYLYIACKKETEITFSDVEKEYPNTVARRVRFLERLKESAQRKFKSLIIHDPGKIMRAYQSPKDFEALREDLGVRAKDMSSEDFRILVLSYSSKKRSAFFRHIMKGAQYKKLGSLFRPKHKGHPVARQIDFAYILNSSKGKLKTLRSLMLLLNMKQKNRMLRILQIILGSQKDIHDFDILTRNILTIAKNPKKCHFIPMILHDLESTHQGNARNTDRISKFLCLLQKYPSDYIDKLPLKSIADIICFIEKNKRKKLLSFIEEMPPRSFVEKERALKSVLVSGHSGKWVDMIRTYLPILGDPCILPHLKTEAIQGIHAEIIPATIPDGWLALTAKGVCLNLGSTQQDEQIEARFAYLLVFQDDEMIMSGLIVTDLKNQVFALNNLQGKAARKTEPVIQAISSLISMLDKPMLTNDHYFNAVSLSEKLGGKRWTKDVAFKPDIYLDIKPHALIEIFSLPKES